MRSGEEQGWKELLQRPPDDVCRRADVSYSRQSGCYTVPVLGQNIDVFTETLEMKAATEDGERILSRFGYFSKLGILRYLVDARDVPRAGKWIGKADLKVGKIYYEGSHVLPLDALAARHNDSPEGFMDRAKTLGGTPLDFGDASTELQALPRIPIALILRRGDDEFPASADILFDAGCDHHVPADIVWSLAMMSVLMMM